TPVPVAAVALLSPGVPAREGAPAKARTFWGRLSRRQRILIRVSAAAGLLLLVTLIGVAGFSGGPMPFSPPPGASTPAVASSPQPVLDQRLVGSWYWQSGSDSVMVGSSVFSNSTKTVLLHANGT